MPKELLIYSPLWDFTAERAVEQLNEIPENEDLTVRINTPGGEVAAGWSWRGRLRLSGRRRDGLRARRRTGRFRRG